MDGATLITAAGTVITIVGSNIALIGWLRSDMKAFELKIDGWKLEIDKEMKDFHGRLCTIEERNKGEK
jgi:hypothetical protein